MNEQTSSAACPQTLSTLNLVIPGNMHNISTVFEKACQKTMCIISQISQE